MTHDVFISHAASDKAVADEVCLALENGSLKCWIAPRDLEPGRSFAGGITRAIQRSGVMVLIFSRHSNNSEQVLREIQLAVDARIPIIQFRIEDVAPNDDFKYFLGTPHWLDALSRPLEKHLTLLEKAIRALPEMSGKSASEVTTVPPSSSKTSQESALGKDKQGGARFRLLSFAGTCVFCTAVILALHFRTNVPFLSRSDQRPKGLFRRAGSKTPTHPEFVYIGISQKSMTLSDVPKQLQGERPFQLMTERHYPWSRELWALLLERLIQAGARLLMFDMVFNPPNEGDSVFRKVIDLYRDKVVLGARIDLSEVSHNKGDSGLIPPNASLIPPPSIADDRVGYVDFFPDSDGKVRAIHYTITDAEMTGRPPAWSREDEPTYESLVTRALEKMGHPGDVPRARRAYLLRASESDSYPPNALFEIFDPNVWRAKYANGEFFRDKVVMISGSAQIMHNIVETPTEPALPNPALHLYALAAALDHDFLSEASPVADGALICFAGLLAWTVSVVVRKAPLRLILFVTVSGAGLLIALLLYNRWGLLVAIVPALTAFVLSGGCTEVVDYMVRRQRRRRLEPKRAGAAA